MTTYDVTPDEEPLDMTAVAGDDVLIERLRRSMSPDSAVVWDDDDDVDDPAWALLRRLQIDVDVDLPALPAILPREVTPLIARRRGFGRGAAVAAVTAGVLSIAGVAAAQPGRPLSGVRTAVESAVTHVVEAITPSEPVGPTAHDARRASTNPGPNASARSEAARSAASAAQVTQALDNAQRFLDRGQNVAAKEQLGRATRALAGITDPAVRGPLATRLATLNARLAAATTADKANRSGKHDTSVDRHGNGTSGKDDGSDSSGRSGSGKDDAVNPSSGKGDTSGTSGKNRDATKAPDPQESIGDNGSHLRGGHTGSDPVETRGSGKDGSG